MSDGFKKNKNYKKGKKKNVSPSHSAVELPCRKVSTIKLKTSGQFNPQVLQTSKKKSASNTAKAQQCRLSSLCQ